MKYVVMSVKFKVSSGAVVEMELPIIFPDALVHSDVAGALSKACSMNWPKAHHIYPVSAGFLSSTVIGHREDGSVCYGESESLGKLKSRGAEDDFLISMADYGSTMK